jgi:hypothetical protein
MLKSTTGAVLEDRRNLAPEHTTKHTLRTDLPVRAATQHGGNPRLVNWEIGRQRLIWFAPPERRESVQGNAQETHSFVSGKPGAVGWEYNQQLSSC